MGGPETITRPIYRPRYQNNRVIDYSITATTSLNFLDRKPSQASEIRKYSRYIAKWNKYMND